MKQKFLLILLLAFVGFGASAQSFTTNWEVSAGNTAYPWFTPPVVTLPALPTVVNGLAYNPIAKKLYVAVRGVGICIIDPVTGSWTSDQKLSTAGIPAVGETGYDKFIFAKVAVTATGEIFAITSAPTVGATLGKCKIYYWSSETAEPELVSGDITDWKSERAGDTFAVTGSGDDVVLYVGGLTGTNVQVIVKDPTTKKFIKVDKAIVLDASTPKVITGYAAGGISPESTGKGSDFWVSGFLGTTNYPMRKYSVDGSFKEIADGALGVITGVPAPNSISKKFNTLKYFEIGTKKFLAVTGAYYNGGTATGEELALHIYDVTNAPTTVVFVAGTKLTNTPINNNVMVAADIDFKKTVNTGGTITMQFFQLIPGNGFAAHTINFKADGTLPVSLSSFNASIVNNQSQLNWSTVSESNNAGFEIESSTDGVSFNKIGFVASKSTNSTSKLTYIFQDKLASSGTTYYRLKQLDLDGKFTYSDVKFINNQILTNAITVSPNPTADFIEVNGLEMDGIIFGLFTANGARLSTKGLVEGNKLSMAGLKAGVYILKVSKNGQLLQTTKVVKN